ncbi:minor capsid protein [Streptococcus cristatus]|uniref:minor capsid protein n=1 Tax=Streptococcus cristatus TaxID=45634 RepID=UPI0007768F9C|nr:minor capsid protein [Streptococcus cristatus]QBX13967.1 minor capsid protein [Streptococcus phage Javan115]
MADVRVVVDLGGVERKVSPENLKRGKLAAASQAKLIMIPYIPMRGGDLRASGRVESNGDVSYNTVYARAHFYGTNGIVVFRRYTTPGTGKRWDKPLKANVEQLKRVAIRAMGLR